jgi:hypothetical protein
VTGWDVFTARPSIPPSMLAELTPLRAALPGYDVIITSHSPSHRYEAIRRHSETGPWCVISTSADDLWRELAPRTSHPANTGIPAARAPHELNTIHPHWAPQDTP